MYKVIWRGNARDNLKGLSKTLALKIEKKIESYLIQDPKNLGKHLTAHYSGLYRYRYGDYRIIYKILEEENTIVILRIGHRKNIYI